MGGSTKLDAVPRWISTGSLIALGVGLSLFHVSHAVIHDEPPLTTLLGIALPFVLSIALVVLGYRLHRSDLSTAHVAVVAAWAGLGAVLMTGVVSVALVHQHLEGTELEAGIFLGATSISVAALFGIVAGRYDVQNRKKTTTIEALQESTAALTAATTVDDVCEEAVSIANRVLGLPISGIWLLEDDELVPTAVANPGRELFDSPPVYRRGNSLSWSAYESGELQHYDDVTRQPNVNNDETIIRAEIIVPLGDYGVMNVGSLQPDAFDSFDVTVARLLGTATTAALRRADREEQLRESRQELARQNARLEEFTSVVSHDLRNPLSVAMGRLELARERIDGEAGAEDLVAADDALERMRTMIDDLLELARQGQRVGDVESVDLESVAEASWQSVETDGVRLECVGTAAVEADEGRLRQLLENLFRNSVEHGSADRLDDPITVRIGPLGDAGFFVEDDGVGIPEHEREKVFDSGYTTNERGTGFGLATVRQIADAHGWSVRATDADGGGARFELRFVEDAVSSRATACAQ